MSSFKKRTGTAVLTLALVGGLVGFSPIAGATSGHHHRHGRSQDTTLTNVVVRKARVTNNNSIDVGSSNYQTASSGEVEATDNTTVGSSTSGNASNSTALAATIAVDNAGSGAALMEAAATPSSEGPAMSFAPHESHHGGGDVTVTNKDISKIYLTNNNTVDVEVCNDQEAASGDVTVSGNTTAGSATSGSASNTSSTTLSISVSN